MKFEYEEDFYNDKAVALIWKNGLGMEFLVWQSEEEGPFWIDNGGSVVYTQRTWETLLEEATKKFYKGDSVTITF